MIYAGATATKIAEHGGFNEDDTHMMLPVANPRWWPTVVKTPVQTMQIAPTILRLLGLNPEWLQAVRLEKTRILPGLPGFGQNEQ